MFKVEIKRKSDQKITHGAKFDTIEEVNEWVEKIESIGTRNPWGLKERLKDKSESTKEEIAESIETIPEVTQVIPAREEYSYVNEEGETVIVPAQPERIEVVQPERIKLPKSYEIIITDISIQVTQQAINEAAKKFLADTDFRILRHVGQVALGIPTSMNEEEYLALEQQRQDARDSIVE